ncbi:hypothetical protein A2641_01655 [Candidatus Nomurabacteria bacterium RIFCSPHIGHO2_01_FULL_37_25]|uniref:Uncharacterized protein n=1 Tax=Candidatus Nomurabacteria bacterium RIFCSPLOWO2_01_FULL_36_16 TaxID=1801767 RepID=A0A1F6WXT9_9BACT|nr:MAG: hypothetical protein A2641_01655 [Candidatus Nomurabacteria bacterium RIFCSPHIGHO2_01_FULL_37_25]OGI74982.1 MAG: hypothetical protein A3D36_00535 [Candidatus Nomurabacteria bacterium RIFCSPHIGHO2_02_FULL_36_29]OGI86688.1 MAG: hypothetical protein A3A91_03560 [Candidatus Nomurabacteria bacterium RIFCSPLOWO2_01_FULL_36_16]OGI96417.1 MAG: hypothetical protein A3I84_02930 [Candidatus Nomurabacteria bacterium RIFCSPLOWO2_02_FULL_36_8]
MNKTIIAIAIVGVVLVGGYFLFRGSYQSTPVPQISNQQPTTQPSDLEPSVSEQPSQQPPTSQTPEVKENLVTYSNSGYSPSTLTIKKGETVTFKNQSSNSMWTASAKHPTHVVYSGTSLSEHCPDPDNTAFDTCTSIEPGDSWSFKFDISGTWKYHNHLNPADTGTIVVE